MKESIRISIAVILMCIISIYGGTAFGAPDYRVYFEEKVIATH